MGISDTALLSVLIHPCCLARGGDSHLISSHGGPPMVAKSDQPPCHPLVSLPSCYPELPPGGQLAPGSSLPISPALGAACTHCPCPGCGRLWAPSYREGCCGAWHLGICHPLTWQYHLSCSWPSAADELMRSQLCSQPSPAFLLALFHIFLFLLSYLTFKKYGMT